MKKILFFILITFLISSCQGKVYIQKTEGVVTSVTLNSLSNSSHPKYIVGFENYVRCGDDVYQSLYLYTDHLYQVGDTIRIE